MYLEYLVLKYMEHFETADLDLFIDQGTSNIKLTLERLARCVYGSRNVAGFA
jgi:hypothetical protein